MAPKIRHRLLNGREINHSFPHVLCATRRDRNPTNVERKKNKAEIMKGEKEDKTNKKANKDTVLLVALSTIANGSSEWIVDQSATLHMSMRKDWFEDMNYRRKIVAIANNEKVYLSKVRTRDVMVKSNCGNSDAVR
jgi:hypothetical protein